LDRYGEEKISFPDRDSNPVAHFSEANFGKIFSLQ